MKILQNKNNYTEIQDSEGDIYLFSYRTCIAVRRIGGLTELDKRFYKYSVTTNKHRCAFLGERLKETEAKIANGTYLLNDLN